VWTEVAHGHGVIMVGPWPRTETSNGETSAATMRLKSPHSGCYTPSLLRSLAKPESRLLP
jgi:hypothetical protein